MEAVLKIFSVIGTGDNEISSQNIADFLEQNKEAKELIVRIKSPGGSVREGWTIYDLLKNSGKKIITRAEGELYSIATVIFLSGNEREIMPNADGLIHMPRIPNPEGDFQADDLREMAEYMDQEEEKILNLYVEVTNQNRETLRDYMKKETMLSADDMLRLGFATKILEPIKAVAYYENKNKIIMDQNEVKTFGEKIEALAKDVKALFSRLPSKDQTIKDKDGKEFKLDKEAGSPAVGDKATPDGTFLMADGKTIVIEGGVVKEINEPVASKTDLEIANEKIAELQKQLDAEKAKVTDVEKEKTALAVAEASFKAEEVKAQALIIQLTNLKNSWKPDARGKFSAAEKVGDINLNEVREYLKKINSKSE